MDFKTFQFRSCMFQCLWRWYLSCTLLLVGSKLVLDSSLCLSWAWSSPLPLAKHSVCWHAGMHSSGLHSHTHTDRQRDIHIHACTDMHSHKRLHTHSCMQSLVHMHTQVSAKIFTASTLTLVWLCEGIKLVSNYVCSSLMQKDSRYTESLVSACICCFVFSYVK